MKVPKIYLETTIFNFPFADDAPQYKSDTLKLFEEIGAGKFKAYTSGYVIRELENTEDVEKRKRMSSLIGNYGIDVLPVNEEAEHLADIYVREGIVPEKYTADAYHIAAASIAGLDFIVSLNFKHIVKRKTIIQTEVINAREGYRRIFIHTPAEVVEYEDT